MNEPHVSLEKEDVTFYQYEVLDPRSVPEAEKSNNSIFSKGRVIGIEVTIPSLSARCLRNLDPQHGKNGDALSSAVEQAITFELPEKNDTIVTLKPDIDSVGAMAILEMRLRNQQITIEMLNRISFIANADRASSAPWPGRRELPNRNNPWPETFFSDPRTVSILSAAVSDFKIPLSNRVRIMYDYIVEGKLPSQYLLQVDGARNKLLDAIEEGDLKISISMSNKISMVVSTHRDALTLGYSLAPIVVALNPEFTPNPKVEPYRKYTVAQYKIGYVNLIDALQELNQTDPAVTPQFQWGGSLGIIGSPQGVSSQLSPIQVAEIIGKYTSI